MQFLNFCKSTYKIFVPIIILTCFIWYFLIGLLNHFSSRSQCKISLFDLMSLPIKRVDSIIESETDIDPDHSRNVILIKIVDNSENEHFFAILNDGPNRSYKTIYNNIPLQWQFQNKTAPRLMRDTGMSNKTTLQVLFENNGNFELVKNQQRTMHCLANLLKSNKHIYNNKLSYDELLNNQ